MEVEKLYEMLKKIQEHIHGEFYSGSTLLRHKGCSSSSRILQHPVSGKRMGR